MGISDFTFYDVIKRNSVCHQNRSAWIEVDDGRTLTFLQVKEQVDRLACGLQNCGVKRGDRIGVVGKNSLEYFLLYGAAAAIGAVLLPINWRLSAEEALFNINDCEPKLVFIDPEFQKVIEDAEEKPASVERYFNLKPPGGVFSDFASLLDNRGNVDPVDVSADDGFVIIHTAAVAGRPRGALLSHRNAICSNIHLGYSMHITENDVHLSLLPLFHVAGLFMAFKSFHAGALNVNMSKFDALQAVELIHDKKISVMFDFAPVLSAILEQHEKTGKDISTLRAVAGIDTPETIEKYQQRTGGTFYSLYGQTETAGFATLGRYNDRPGAAGKMLQLAQVGIVDEGDRLVSAGEIGEIVAKGPMIFKGYWNLPDDTDYTFRNGWHHTGDLGRFDAEGFLWYEGRKAEKELIKPGGENVYPAEVERAILEHPAVEAVVVIGVPDPKWKEAIKAVCRLEADVELDAPTLIRFVGERIASYKKPQYVEFVSDFPTLSNGTPDRERIKSRFGGE